MNNKTIVQMTAMFKLLTRDDNGEYTPIGNHFIDSYLSLGSFSFIIDGKTIPFDFDATSYNESDGVFTWESGKGMFFNEYELCRDFDAQYTELGIDRTYLTAKKLASVSAIEDFYVNFEAVDGKEYEGGFYSNNVAENVDMKVELINIVFCDKNNNYTVAPEVLENFNKGMM